MGIEVYEGIIAQQILLLCVYLTEIIKYWIALNGIWNVKARYGIIILTSGILYTIIILCGIIKTDTPLIWVWSINLIIFLYIKNNSKEDKIKLLKAFLIITCLGEVIGLFILMEKEKNFHESLTNYYLFNNILCIASLVVIILIKKYSTKALYRLQCIYQKFIYVIVLLIALVLLLTISGIQFTMQYVDDKSIKILFGIISILSFLGIGLLGIIFTYFDNENKRIKKYWKADKLLLKTQESFYEAMLTKENDTRRFRHDIINHMIYINELAEKGKTEQIKEYINDLCGYMKIIDNRYNIVGNNVIEAIINYYTGLLDKDVKVTVSGRCNCKLEISEVDLCTIISNLIQNSIEAILRQENGERYLKIEFSRGEVYLKMEIINSMKDNLKTIKQDKRNHGIGLKNVKETVEKNNGKFDISKKELEFSAEVILPIKKIYR